MKALRPVSSSPSCTTFFAEDSGDRVVVKLYFIKNLGLSEWFYQKRLGILRGILDSLSTVSHSSLPTYRLDKCFEPNDLFGADLYYARDYIEGSSLDIIIPTNKSEQPRTLEVKAWKLIHDLSSALLYLQQHTKKGICHGNIKPQNIISTPEGIYVLTDVGICPHFLTSVTNLSVLHSSIQTSRFYQPKEFYSTVDIAPSFDIWSLGCVLCEFLSGEPLYADKAQSIRQDIITLRRFPYSNSLLHLTHWMLAVESATRIELATLVDISAKGAAIVTSVTFSGDPITDPKMCSLCEDIIRQKNLSGSISSLRILETSSQTEEPEYLPEEKNGVVQQMISNVNKHKLIDVSNSTLLVESVTLEDTKKDTQIQNLTAQVDIKNARIEKLSMDLEQATSVLAILERKFSKTRGELQRLEQIYTSFLVASKHEPAIHPVHVNKLLHEKNKCEETLIADREKFTQQLSDAHETIKQLRIAFESKIDAHNATIAELAATKQELANRNDALLRDKRILTLQNAIMSAESERSALQREVLAARRDIKALVMMHKESVQAISSVKERLNTELERSNKLQERCRQLEDMLNLDKQVLPADFVIERSFLEEKLAILERENEKLLKEVDYLKAVNGHGLPPPPPYLEKNADLDVIQSSEGVSKEKTKIFLERFDSLMQDTRENARHYKSCLAVNGSAFIVDPRLIPTPAAICHEILEGSDVCTLHEINYAMCGSSYRMLYEKSL
ncbi:Kinase [Giardia lamblia P15]|uniref:Kinase n=1 Tax=Giardia intestinalis (strain P15) TaxID=658858 RepID=E1EZ46_GIAIA|nr:Kinase [Giardia lamblia P15]